MRAKLFTLAAALVPQALSAPVTTALKLPETHGVSPGALSQQLTAIAGSDVKLNVAGAPVEAGAAAPDGRATVHVGTVEVHIGEFKNGRFQPTPEVVAKRYQIAAAQGDSKAGAAYAAVLATGILAYCAVSAIYLGAEWGIKKVLDVYCDRQDRADAADAARNRATNPYSHATPVDVFETRPDLR